jgi:predicted DNA-binding protein YlxM (UPF0122 family)
VTPENEAIVKKMFEEGYSVDLIAFELKVQNQVIHKHLKRREMTRPRCAVKFRMARVEKAPIVFEGTSLLDDCLRVLSRKLPE